MKNIILKIITLLLGLYILNSCNNYGEDSNPMAGVFVYFKDNKGDDLYTNELRKDLKEYRSELRIKLYSDRYNETFEQKVFNDNFNIINLPLELNSRLVDKELPKLDSEYETFDCTILRKEEVIFKEKFKVKYKEGNPFKIITEVKVLNEGDWIDYKPQNIEIIINDKSTGAFLSIHLN